jgi:biofilm PGA synthesis N-glycosyltransferase PgaC
MAAIKMFLNSFIFWGGWILIPFLMEIIPALGSVILLVKRNKRRKVERAEIKVFPEISLIIPVYNSADTLFQCIESINNSTYPNDRIRIFLVNNKGQDNSFEVYADCQRKFPDLIMQWLNAEQGKSRALNLALYNSEGKYIINLDSDGVLEKNALVNMITKFESDTELNCMTGAILTMPELIMKYKHFFPRLLRNLEFMEYAQAFLAGRSYASEMNAVYTLSGAFSAFRKSAVLKSWMYNTDTICEDTHITFQMRYKQNERVEVCEDALFFVDPIEDVNKLYTQRQRWQRGSLEVAQMFMDKDFKVKNIFSNISVKTLMYDHTFAFPRLIWYLALICLMVMGYSGKVIVISTGIIFAMYTLIGYMYFATVLYFLNINKEVKKYYRNHWWCILFLPFFNFAVFFIRMAGIINSINTDSAWRTRNLTDERIAFTEVIKSDIQKPIRVIRKIRNVVNISPKSEATATTDNSIIDENVSADSKVDDDNKQNNIEKIKGTNNNSYMSLAQCIAMSLLFVILSNAIFMLSWIKSNVNMHSSQIIEYMASMQFRNIFVESDVRGAIIGLTVITLTVILIFSFDFIYCKKNSAKWILIFNKVIMYVSVVAVLVVVLLANYQFGLLDYFRNWLIS